jgi:hypothetical protein
MEGIQTLRKGVLYDKVETQGTFYIDNQTHRGKWIFGKEGTLTSVERGTTDVAAAVEAELSMIPTQSFTVCPLHTHPLSAGESDGIISTIISTEEWQNIKEGKHSISFPPSGSLMYGDISISNIIAWREALNKFREKGITAQVRQGVVDAAGISYYRLINDQELQQEFPDYFVELERRKAISRKWEEVVGPLLFNLIDNLDNAMLDELHRHTKYSGRYDTLTFGDANDRRTWKRLNLYRVLREGEDGREEIARVLFAGNQKAQKLQEDYVTQVVDKAARDRNVLDEVRLEWTKTSMTVSPEQLPFTEEYAKLRGAYARNGSKIRFVPHQNVVNEPPCAGTDYKP